MLFLRGGGGDSPLGKTQDFIDENIPKDYLQDSKNPNDKNIESKLQKLKIFGIDGNDVDSSLFYIDKKFYRKVDLTQDFRQILKQIEIESGAKKFDLAESLEVAEHLHKEYARNFVSLLTSLSDIVLFYAAIPFQGGTNHFNEQPPSYWAKYFKEFDFVCFDFRNKVWENKKIACYYRQNVLLFAHKSKRELLESKGLKMVENPMHLVHYEGYEWKDYQLTEATKKLEKLEYFYKRSLRYYIRHPKKILSIFSKNK